jgi:hypothetical protein
MPTKNRAEKSLITLERLKEVLHYEPETGVFTWIVSTGRRVKAGGIAGCTANERGAYVIGVDGRNYLAHRLAHFYVVGRWPEGGLDHIDRNPSNNRIRNLRCVSNSENCQNKDKPSNNTSGYLGVCWCKAVQKWQAKIGMPIKRTLWLGNFDTIEEAVAARKAAELIYYPTKPQEATHG